MSYDRHTRPPPPQDDPHYRDIVEGSLQGIIVQQNDRIVFANPAMAKLFGYSAPAEMIGLSPFEGLIDEENLGEFRERTAAVYRNEKVSSHPGWKAKRRDHKPAWMASTAQRTEWRGRPAVASFYLDVTDSRKAEIALRENEARYRAALVAARMGAWETDLIEKKRIWTPEGMALFGLSLSDGIGTVGGDNDEYVAAIHPDDRRLVADFYRQAETTDGFPAEYRIIRPDGGQLWLAGRGQVISRANNGRAQRLISIMGDVTERKATDQRVATLMHELAHRSANLLAVVQSIARRIDRSSLSLDDFHSRFEARLRALANSHQALAKQSWAAASLDDLVREQLQPFVPDRSSMLEVDGPIVDLPAEIAQTVGLAIHELATNALKHGAWSSPGGKVFVHWKLDHLAGQPRSLVFEWRERGSGPRRVGDARKGFGHVVLYELIPQSFRGTTRGEFLEDGFCWVMSLPEPQLKRDPFHTA